MVRTILFFMLLAALSFSCKNDAQNGADSSIMTVPSSTISNTDTETVKTQELSKFDDSYVHVVYFWLKRPDNKKDRAFFENSLRNFLDTSAYAKTQFIGTPTKAIREVVDDSYTYNLIVTFDSAQAQVAYQQEAPHKKFIEEAGKLWEKVIVYDATAIND